MTKSNEGIERQEVFSRMFKQIAALTKENKKLKTLNRKMDGVLNDDLRRPLLRCGQTGLGPEEGVG